MTTYGPAPPSATDGPYWYCLGRRMPQVPANLGPSCLQSIKERSPDYDFKPTIWEAADTYLKRELRKPKGPGRDLLREMCMIYVMKIQGNQKVGFRSESTKHIFALNEGAIMMYPTVDLPPHIFGTIQNPSSPLLVDTDTNAPVPPGTAVILMSYMTRTAKGAPRRATPGDPNFISLNDAPYE